MATSIAPLLSDLELQYPGPGMDECSDETLAHPPRATQTDSVPPGQSPATSTPGNSAAAHVKNAQ
jgi:hypothetical protein